MIYSRMDSVEKKCFSCKKNDHFITSCPLLTLKINKEKIIKQFVENFENQKREDYQRKRKKFALKKNFTLILKSNQRFLNEQEELCFKFKFYKYHFYYLGSFFLEDIEKKQDELFSAMNFPEEDSSTHKEISSYDFDKQFGNSLLTYGDDKNNNRDQFQNNFNVKRSLLKKSTLSPFLKNDEEEKTNSEQKDVSKNAFKSKNHLQIDTEHNSELKNGKKPQPIMDFSGQPTQIDFFEFSLIFDRMKCYKSYFPHNNADNVVKKLNFGNNIQPTVKKIRLQKYRTKAKILNSLQFSQMNSSSSIEKIAEKSQSEI